MHLGLVLARLYQITGLPLSDLQWNSCKVSHIYQTHINHGLRSHQKPVTHTSMAVLHKNPPKWVTGFTQGQNTNTRAGSQMWSSDFAMSRKFSSLDNNTQNEAMS